MRLFRNIWQRSNAQAKVAIRDTNHDWEVIGATEPFFGVLSNERFRRQNISERAIKDFYRTGYDAVDTYLRKIRCLGPFTPRSALDFGCGVGRLSIPLTHLTGSVVGVDISPGMIAEAKKNAPAGLTFTNEIPEQSFDWVISIIVFQHIPPVRGLILLRKLLSRLALHGGATIQIMFARTEQHRGSPGERTLICHDGIETRFGSAPSYAGPPGVILMHDYDMSAVLAEFFTAGIMNLFIEYCDHGGHIGATISGLKEC